MSAASDSNGRAGAPENGEGVLANLPRTRPQRSTARRAAARKQAAATQAPERAEAQPATKARPARKAQSKPATAKPAKSRGAGASAPAGSRARKPAGAPGSKASAKATSSAGARTAKRSPGGARLRVADGVREEVPRQGFESEMDRARGPVQPPGATELVASAAEIVGELARAGLSTGERLLKDAFTRLPRP